MGDILSVGGVPDEPTLELWLFGDVYRMLTLGQDRRPEGYHKLDPVTGLPADPGMLSNRPLRGEALALQWPVQPWAWARMHMGLWAHPPETWLPEAHQAVLETETKLKRIIKRLARRSPPLMDDEPDLGMGPMGIDTDGECLCARFTHAGLAHARKIIPGTKYEHGPVSALVAIPEDQRQSVADWIKSEARHEGAAPVAEPVAAPAPEVPNETPPAAAAGETTT